MATNEYTILSLITHEEFENQINRREPFVSRNETINMRYILKIAKEGKCKDCGKIGYTILSNGDGQINMFCQCRNCYVKWYESIIRHKQGKLKEAEK